MQDVCFRRPLAEKRFRLDIVTRVTVEDQRLLRKNMQNGDGRAKRLRQPRDKADMIERMAITAAGQQDAARRLIHATYE
jgi:hypothetical protein